jgi:hypothetical protein
LNGVTEDPETTAKPTPEDQLRLVIIYYLTVPDNAISKEDMNELTNVLKLAGADLKALDYVKKWVEPRLHGFTWEVDDWTGSHRV